MALYVLLRRVPGSCYSPAVMRNPTSDRLLADIAVELIPGLDEIERILTENARIQNIPAFDQTLTVLQRIIPRLKEFQPRRETRFWNRIIRKGEHMIWIGGGREGPDGAPVCEWHGKRTTAARVAWNLLNPGDLLKQGERLRHVCPEPRCVSPTCYHRASGRPRKSGRVWGSRFDMHGNLCCPQGHVYVDRFGRTMKEKPKYSGEPYCASCHRLKQQRQVARVRNDALDFGARVLSPEYDTPEGFPLILPPPPVATPVMSTDEQDELTRLFRSES